MTPSLLHPRRMALAAAVVSIAIPLGALAQDSSQATDSGSRAGSLVALDRATGSVGWIYLEPPSEDVVNSHREWGFGAAPVIADGVVYAADLAGKVHAFELGRPQQAQLFWKTRAGHIADDGPSALVSGGPLPY